MKKQDMTNDDNVRTLGELNRLPNDPDVPMQPVLIWRLVNEVLEHELNGPDVPMQSALIWRLVEEVLEHDLQAGIMLSHGARLYARGARRKSAAKSAL